MMGGYFFMFRFRCIPEKRSEKGKNILARSLPKSPRHYCSISILSVFCQRTNLIYSSGCNSYQNLAYVNRSSIS